MNKRRTIRFAAVLLMAALGITLLSGCAGSSAPKQTVTVFKSPSCGCCAGYVAELKSKGFTVVTKEMSDMAAIKQQHSIPPTMQSCHTAVIGDYFIEGHVPVQAVNKMLAEHPAIDGIALPGMPAGSAGMPGTKRGTWTIYALTNGKISEFMKI